MKKIAVTLTAVLVVAGVLAAQQKFENLRAHDLQAGFNAGSEVFEGLMKTIEQALAADPNNAMARVTHGIGTLRRASEAMQKGDAEASGKFFQAGVAEMEQGVQLAPDNAMVRVPRGSVLLSASRFMPPQVGKPLLDSGLADFEKVLQLQSADQTFSRLSAHERGELLTGLAEGWARKGETAKARAYFERINAELEGTIYAGRAQAWFDGKPESKAPNFFACAGCHTE